MHSSEEFEPRRVIEVKEEHGYEENVEEDFDDEDDEDDTIEGEIEINEIFLQVLRWLKKKLKKGILYITENLLLSLMPK